MQFEVRWKRAAICAMVFSLHVSVDAAEVDPLKWRWAPIWRSLEASTGKAADPNLWRTLPGPVDKGDTVRLGKIMEMERLGTFRSFAGDELGAIRAFDARAAMTNIPPMLGDGDLEGLAGAEQLEAVAAIVEEAKSRQIVMLNEAHHLPMHRAFAALLARELKKIGYEVLACEGVEQPPAADALVDGRSGFYAREAHYGNLLREATAAGWQIIGYDMQLEQGKDSKMAPRLWREVSAARQILKQTVQDGRQKKVFIYVGYSHLAELPEARDDNINARLAAQLKQMSGIDPLTVDQTTFFAHSERADEHPLYARIPGSGQAGRPFVLRTAAHSYAVLGEYAGRVDMQVFYPRQLLAQTEHGRSAWLSELLGLQPRAIPAKLLPAKGTRMVSAFRKGDPATATPVDTVLAEAGKVPAKFMLPPGEFDFRIRR